MASRPWNGFADLRGMQQLALEQRRLLGPRAPWHVGDLAWGFRRHAGREHEWRITVWEEGGAVVGWTWLQTETGRLELDVLAERLDLLDEMLHEPDATTAFAFDDDERMRQALARNGFVQPGETMRFNVRDLSEPPELPPLPDGFRYRTAGPDDLAERVALHRDVWAPSRLTEESFADVTATWPYRGSLDCVVESPEGRFAAYCHVWPDDENAVGELEPVGVREEFRRRGLGAAVCTYALRRLYDEGGRQAIVYCFDGPACELYGSIGFRRHATLVGYSR